MEKRDLFGVATLWGGEVEIAGPPEQAVVS